MARGRHRKPTALHVVQGTARPDRTNPAEPRPELAIPPCPPTLTGEARAEWDRVTVELHQLGLLGRIDMALLAVYCQTWAEYLEACEQLTGGRSVIQGVKGPVRNPWAILRKQAAETLLKVAPHFGLSAATRARLNAAPPPPVDPFAKWMEKRGKRA